MATAVSVTYNFVAGTPSVADNVDQNFTDLVTWINTNAVHLDGSKAFTAVPSGPATDPVSANELARKAYVDAVLPIGIIQAFAGSAAPSANWLLCQGQAVSRSTYSSLFGLVGTTYGVGDGSTTFNVPNLSGRVLVGRDAGQTEFDTLGETGGAKTHTLTSGEMPSHSHTQDAHNHTQNAHNHGQDAHNHSQNAHNHTQDAHGHGMNDPTHAHDQNIGANIGAGGSTGFNMTSVSTTNSTLGQYTNGIGTNAAATNVSVQNTTATNQAATATNIAATATNQAATATNIAATATNQNTGGGGAHNNLQPYIVLNYVIKAL
jgi:microcystin-dependent protein